jgi:hypothetical protein
LDTTQATSDVVREMAAAMEENRRYLTKLDSEIGDGDHGNNMNRGFQAALERLESADASTPAEVLKARSAVPPARSTVPPSCAPRRPSGTRKRSRPRTQRKRSKPPSAA